MLNFDVAASVARPVPATPGGRPDHRAAAAGDSLFDRLLAQLAGVPQASPAGAADPKATAPGKDAKKAAFGAPAGRRKTGDAPADGPVPAASDEGRHTAPIAIALGGFLNLDSPPTPGDQAAPGGGSAPSPAVAGATPDGAAPAIVSPDVARQGVSADAAALNAMPAAAADSAATTASAPPASANRTGDPSMAAQASDPAAGATDATDPPASLARAGRSAAFSPIAAAPAGDTKPGQPAAAQAPGVPAAASSVKAAAETHATIAPAVAPQGDASKPAAAAPPMPDAPLVQQALGGRAATADAGRGHSGQTPSDAKTTAATVAASPTTAQATPVFHVPIDLQPPVAHQVAAAQVVAPGPGLDASAEAALPVQIVQSMKLQWASGAGDATIRLKPEYLGDLTVSIRVEQGQVTASLQASTPEVREWIQGHESMLRQGLADQGLNLDRLVVSDDASNPSHDREAPDGHAQGRGQQQAPPRQRRQTDDATFELLV